MVRNKVLVMLERLYKAGGEPVQASLIAHRLGCTRDNVYKHLSKHRDKVNKEWLCIDKSPGFYYSPKKKNEG